MDTGGRTSFDKLRTESMDSEDLLPPGTSPTDPFLNKPETPIVKATPKGVEIAKKRLRAFSIQKKSSLTQVSVPKPVNTGAGTVLIGKLANAKQVFKPDPESGAEKKPPKPPKPGTNRHSIDSYGELQKKTLSEIETMKRKMEMVELGIPLGLICPAPNSDQAMPTKAMPPIKSLLDPAKLDEIIRDAKKAKAEGKEFKFNYKSLLPDYDNPFQRKKEEEKRREDDYLKRGRERHRDDKYDPRKSKYDRRHSGIKKPDRYKDRIKERDRPREREEDRDKTKEKDQSDDKLRTPKVEEVLDKDTSKIEVKDKVEDKKDVPKDSKEADVNLKDYLVCDSWSLDTEEKAKDASPKLDTKKQDTPIDKVFDQSDILKTAKDGPLGRHKKSISIKINSGQPKDSPKEKPKIEKLQPVIDMIKFEIEDDEILDMFDENTSIEDFSKTKSKKDLDSPIPSSSKYDEMKDSMDELADDTFLESVINEIKHEAMDEDDDDKTLVEYDVSPKTSGSVTPELDPSWLNSSRSDYSDSFKSIESVSTKESGYKSAESGYKSTESGYKSTESGYKSSARSSVDKDFVENKIASSTMDSLEMWSFVLKICQPLLFRHDKNRCYKETRSQPKVWFSCNPKACACVSDRRVVYDELEMCKMDLVDRVYACDQVPEAPPASSRGWYAARWWGAAPGDGDRAAPRRRDDELSLDMEYQRFMEAVWPEVDKSETPRSTPVRTIDKKEEEQNKMAAGGWSQESEGEGADVKIKKQKVAKEKRKRKRSPSTSSSDSEVEPKKKKKAPKKKDVKKAKEKEEKRETLSKKYLKKLKEKQKKKKLIVLDEESESDESEKKKKSKKEKKKKLLKQKKKKKNAKKKKNRRKSSSSSSSSDSSSETDSDFESKKKSKEKKKKKKRKQSSSESQSEELFDVNILNNIKKERITEEEKRLEFSPRKQKPREIIDVKELQSDFVGKNQIQIKKEVEEKQKGKEVEKEVESREEVVQESVEVKEKQVEEEHNQSVELKEDTQMEIKEIKERTPTPPSKPPPEENSQSSQSSTISKDFYEKDESHLRPPSQNSNYSFQDVHNEYKDLDSGGAMEAYDMYEQMAMEYQSDVATEASSVSCSDAPWQRIETVVRARSRGEIKCDWRAGEPQPHLAPQPARPSRWGLKPGEVNIVLTGGGQSPAAEAEAEPDSGVYRIQSLANRTDSNSNSGYDEAYRLTYGAADALQYGDCFAERAAGSLDRRIQLALSTTVLGEVAKDTETKEEAEERDKGILVTKPESRGVKRVSFADGYKPGQDSDVEDPPVKRRGARVLGCAWPCPASHPDHVSLWDALPPPPPPPGDPPAHLYNRYHKFDPTSLPAFMPPEPPPGVLTF